MIAPAATSPNPIARTTAAPRSQRNSTSDRAPARPDLSTAAMCRPRAGKDSPAPAVRRTCSTACELLAVSVNRRELLTIASSAPNRAATLAAFEEQPASLSSRA